MKMRGANATAIHSSTRNTAVGRIEIDRSQATVPGVRISTGGKDLVTDSFSRAVSWYGMPPVKPGRLFGTLVEHWLFKYGINFMIMLCVIQMGVQEMYKDGDFKRIWVIWDVTYTIICTVEMLLMIEAYRLVYFKTRWMLLDFGLAVLSIVDVILLAAGALTGNLSMLRMFRLVRMLRLVRVMRTVPACAVILDGLIDSFLSVFWIFIVLLLILYAAGICCVRVLGRDDSGFPAYDETVPGDFNNYIYFGNLWRSMLTLLGMLLLAEWDIIRRVAEVHELMVIFFVLLLVLVTFGVLNVIIGIVVEKTTEAMNEPRLEHIARDMDEKANMSVKLAELLYEFDKDNDGHVDLIELEAGLENVDFAETLKNLELPQNFKISEFLCMLDVNGDGRLSKHEFVSGLLRLIFSNDWQRECLHAAAMGSLHRSLHQLGREVRANLANIQSEVRTFMADFKVAQLNFDVNHCEPASDASAKRQKVQFFTQRDSTFVAETPTAQWEPLPEMASITNVESHRSASNSRGGTQDKISECSVSQGTVQTSMDGGHRKFERTFLDATKGSKFSDSSVHANSDGVGYRPRVDSYDGQRKRSGDANLNSQALIHSSTIEAV